MEINILRTLPDNEEKRELSGIVKDTFLQDQTALAHRAKYWVACTTLPLDSSHDAWMDFQQSCAVMALTVWKELHG